MSGNYPKYDEQQIMRASGRRCRAALLVVAWLAFWLTTVATPLQHGYAEAADHHAAAATPASGLMSSHADHHDPAPRDSHCPDVSAVTVNTMFFAAFDNEKVDAVFEAHSIVAVAEQPYRELRGLKLYHPPPPVDIPLYLLIQRLLI